MTGRCAAGRLLAALPFAALALAVAGNARAAPQTAAEQLPHLIGQLGDFDYAVRTEASRAVRRADPAVAGPALRDAVRRHEDSYVQFRALVLLYGLDLPDARDAFAEALESPNDRVRAAAYGYFEFEPDPAIAPRLLAALDRETSEFVRPALVRALAANDDGKAVREQLVRDIDRGETFFRAVVIEALGDHRAEYAVDALLPLAAAPGVLQDDALLALGKIGDRRAAGVITEAHPLVDETLRPVMSAASGGRALGG
ncbi:MAG: HEAT repeat domain-containing protein [Acidobacteria bacterium]|nr:HEAT repeat domain-containing protein [Acidobacteriota bacterium]